MATVRYNGVDIPAESKAGIEVARWERPFDYRPENHPYPRMLYKAFKGSDGVVRCMGTEPRSRHLFISDEQFRSAIEDAKIFTEQCQKIVQNDEEKNRAFSDGWRDTPNEAIEAAKHWETVILGEVAANRAFGERNMSEQAQVEIKAIEASTPNILPEIPEARLDKRTRAYKDSQRQLANA
jgi:hypothetical protein